MIAPPGCECQPEEPPGSTVICAMATSVPNCSGMVPCDVSVPRANGMFVSPDGGVAQLGATVTARVTAVTTLASPTPSSAPLMARFMLPPGLLASLRGYVARHPDNPGPCLTSAARPGRSALGLGLDWPLGTAEPGVEMVRDRGAGGWGQADDRAVPGRWEGDLLMGKDCKSAVGTLVERTTRSILLLHLPAQRLPGRARDAAGDHHQARRPGCTITWDRAKRTGLPRGLHHRQRPPGLLRPAHKPGQRGSNENTNGCCIRRFWWLLTPGPPGKSTVSDPGGDVARPIGPTSGRAAGRRNTGTPGSCGPGRRRTKSMTC